MTGIKRASPGADEEKALFAPIELSESDAKKLKDIQDRLARIDLALEIEENKRYLPAYEARRDLIKTIPNFWAVTLMHNDTFILHLAHAADRQALTYIEDIWVVKDDKDPRAFTLEFTWKENPYFSDTLLKKTFKWVPSPDSDNTPDENGISQANIDFNWETDIKADSTKINWKDPEQALTKLYPRQLNEDDDDLPAEAGSFFNFFEHESDPFELGIAIAQDIFPDAINFFLELDSDDEEDDDDDAEEIDLEKPKSKKRKV
ncbi:hypothetical protein DL96DRAFT_1694069 [Flagelloscypha sp. PMI_526]|nr:hypothetical protein DL96DRAFT_1694069 [Flagelloscypha sp. PMI_526]